MKIPIHVPATPHIMAIKEIATKGRKKEEKRCKNNGNPPNNNKSSLRLTSPLPLLSFLLSRLCISYIISWYKCSLSVGHLIFLINSLPSHRLLSILLFLFFLSHKKEERETFMSGYCFFHNFLLGWKISFLSNRLLLFFFLVVLLQFLFFSLIFYS